MQTRRDINWPIHGWSRIKLWKSAFVVTLIALIAGSLVIAPSSSSLADSKACGELRISLSDQFPDQDCTRERSRSGGYDGASWVETIKSTNTEFYLNLRAQRAANSRTYFRTTNIRQLFEDYNFDPDVRIVGEPKDAMDGVKFVTIRGDFNCILFLKQAMPRTGGYAFFSAGIGCDHDKVGIYSEEDANRLISQIDFATR